MSYWILFAYTVDGDHNMSTAYDAELYLQLYDANQGKYYDPIQLTDNDSIAVSRPQFTSRPYYEDETDDTQYDCKLFWYEAADTTREEYANWKKNVE